MYICMYVHMCTYVCAVDEPKPSHTYVTNSMIQDIASQHCTCMVHECRVLCHSVELILQVVLL